VVTDGESKLEGMKPLLEGGAKAETILVVIDREQSGKKNLEKQGFQLHAVTTLSEVVQALIKTRKVSEEQAETILRYIKKQ